MSSSKTANGLTNSPIDLNEPSTLFHPMLASAIVCCVLTTVFIALRLYTKYQTKLFALEDYLLIFTWPVYITYATVMAVSGKIGVGHFLWYVPGSTDFSGLKYPWALELLFNPLMMSARTALILQLIRIFAPQRRGLYYWIFQTIIWVNLLFYFAIEIALIFTCYPIHKIWQPTAPGHCINAQGILVGISVINVTSDFFALIVPVAAIWHLQMAVKRKVGSTIVFAFGIVALATSIGRLVYSVYANRDHASSYALGQVSIWSMGEIGALILVTCFPVMPRFLQIVSGKMSTHGKSYDKSYSKSSGYHSSIKLKDGPFGTHAGDRTALTDPEKGKDVPTGNAAAAWGGKRSKAGTAANPTFQEMLDGDTLGGAESSGSLSDGSLAHGLPGVPPAAHGHGHTHGHGHGPTRGVGVGADGQIKRTISVDLSTQYMPNPEHT